ncbi:MFS transporter [Roseateles sp. DB2]|uniref:MFS transporter n=1 Tax=Roseateles sp. DB2 TaxID=3453717 RepID=UPI003EEAEBB7
MSEAPSTAAADEASIRGGFLRFCVGDVATQLGSALSLVLLPLIAVTALHATPLQVGMLTACDRLPFIFFSLVAGLAADRWERRRILLVCNLARAALIAGVLAAEQLNGLGIMTFAVAMFLIGSANVYFEVAYWTFVPALLPPSRIARGNGTLAAIAGAAEMIGPAAAGLLLKFGTLAGALACNGMLFLCGAGVLATLPPLAPGAQEPGKGGGFAAIRAGMKALLGRPELRSLVLTGMVWNALASGATPQVLVHMSQTLGFSPADIGLVLAAQGLGGMLGSLVAGEVAARAGAKRAIFLGAMVYGLGSLALTLVHGKGAAAVGAMGALLLVSAAGSSVGVVCIISQRQTLTPQQLLGRVTAGFRFMTWGVMPPAALAGGLLAQGLGTRATIGLAAAAGLCILLLAMLRSPRQQACEPGAEPGAESGA